MADNDQNNDEYKFVELDGLDNETMGDPEHGAGESSYAKSAHSQANIKKNALIAIGVIILIMVMYKLFGYLFSHKTESVAVKKNTTTITQVTTEPEPPTTVVTSVPVQPVTQPVVQPIITENTDLTKKVTAIEISQQNVRSEVSTVSQQVGVVNNNVTNLNNQIASLNQVINNLSSQLAKQSDEISVLMARTQPKKIVTHIIKTTTPPLIYYIQAVIPGRAWLIGTNGSTLTVREGTKIAGYGIVKLIDPLQGRVITSSGQVIRFSQEDS
jgi:intracellular multiplication protein IcmG